MKHTRILTLTLLAVFALSLPMVGLAQGQSLLHRKDKTELVEDAEVEVEEERAKGNEKSEEARVAACEKIQTSLQEKAGKYKDNAGKYLGVVDKIADKIQSFYDDEKMSAPNYAQLVIDVETARNEAELSLETLGELETEVDCENPNAAKNASAFRGGAAQTKELLHAYSASVRKMISAMQSVNSSANSGGEPADEPAEQPDGENDDDGVEPVEVETDKDDDPTEPDVPPPGYEEGL